MAPTRHPATTLPRILAMAGLALVAAVLPLAAQSRDAAAIDPDDEEFRQQVPLGAITGNAQMLRQRILSATSYRMTAGDTYELQIQVGSERVSTFPLVLQDDYELELPYLGTIDVEGRLFSDVRREVVRRIRAQGTVRFASFVLRQPALFDVFIFGGVANPGIYTMTPLSRVSDLVTAAKGPQAGASLRRVELTRDGGVAVLDLTRFSTRGDLAANPTLAPGDRVRIPRAPNGW